MVTELPDIEELVPSWKYCVVNPLPVVEKLKLPAELNTMAAVRPSAKVKGQ